LINSLKAFWQEEDGQDLVEYSLLLAFIALGAIAILTTVKASITTLWTTVNTSLGTANKAAGGKEFREREGAR
jgi:Flp pilus assembly pilin Flp